MAKRLVTAYKPYVVVSVVEGRQGKTRSYEEDFDTEAAAMKRAKAISRDRKVVSVFIDKQDADGYRTKEGRINVKSIQGLKRDEPVESAVTGSDSAK